jgi:hypothetical protein
MEEPSKKHGRTLQKQMIPSVKGINLHPQTKFCGSQIPIQNPSPNIGISLADWWNRAYFQALGFLCNNAKELTFKSLSSK